MRANGLTTEDATDRAKLSRYILQNVYPNLAVAKENLLLPEKSQTFFQRRAIIMK